MTQSRVAPDFVPVGRVIGHDEALRITQAAKQAGRKRTDAKAETLVIPQPLMRAVIIDWTDKAWPQGMRTIGNLATRQGFEVVGSHAIGPWIGDVPLRVMRICDSVLLRMRHPDGRRASALWVTDAHDEYALECMVLLTPWLQLVKSATFKDYLKTPRATEDAPEGPATAPVSPVDLEGFDVADSAS